MSTSLVRLLFLFASYVRVTTLSPDGSCLALGTLTGAVSVYGTSSLTKLYHVEKCHRSFVTRVEFLKTCLDVESETKSSEHLVSISVDNQIYLHTIPLNGKDAFFSGCPITSTSLPQDH